MTGTADTPQKNDSETKDSSSSTDTHPNNDDSSTLEPTSTEPSDKQTKEKNAPKVDANKDTSSPSKPSKSRLSLVLFIILLLLIGALAVAAYFGWQEWQTQTQRIDELAQQNQQEGDDISALQAFRNTQENNQSAQLDQLSQLGNSVRALETQVDSQGERLSNLSGTSRNDWLLAEARYLLRLANQRLLVDRKTDGAIGLLESTDTILSQIDNRDLLPIRNAIAQELIALKLASEFDREGTYLTLLSLKQEIQKLPLIPKIQTSDTMTASNSEEESSGSNENTTNSVWHKVLNTLEKAKHELKSFVQIRHHDQIPELLINEQQQQIILNTLSLMFEQAQFGLLHEEPLIYQKSLDSILSQWQTYYIHYPEYETIRQSLTELQQLKIDHRMPSINRSSQLLSDYISRYHQLNAAPAAVEGNTP